MLITTHLAPQIVSGKLAKVHLIKDDLRRMPDRIA
jgi:hypothetical protein